MADGIQIVSPGACTDRTLPALNPKWTPAMLPGILDYWDSQTNITVASGLVTDWKGALNSSDITFASGVQPANAGVTMNALGVPVFSTSKGLFASPVSAAAVLPCFYAVFNVGTAMTTQNTIFSCAGLTVHINNSTNKPQIYVGSVAANGPNALAVGAHVLAGYFDSTGTLILRIDGVQVGTVTGASAQVLTGARLGRYYGDQDNTALVNVGIGAFGVAAGEQDLVSVQKIEGHLAQAYISSVFLPPDHPYRSVVPRKLN